MIQRLAIAVLASRSLVSAPLRRRRAAALQVQLKILIAAAALSAGCSAARQESGSVSPSPSATSTVSPFVIRDVAAAADNYERAEQDVSTVVSLLRRDPAIAVVRQSDFVRDDLRSGDIRARHAFHLMPQSVETAVTAAHRAYDRARDAFEPLRAWAVHDPQQDPYTGIAIVNAHPEITASALEESRAAKRATEVLRSWLSDNPCKDPSAGACAFIR